MHFQSTFFAFGIAALSLCHSAVSQTTIASSSYPVVHVSRHLKCTAEGKPEFLQISNLDQFQSHYIRIFNRQGKLIYSTDQYKGKWPDDQVLENKYFYLLQLDDKRISGWIEIDRCSSSLD